MFDFLFCIEFVCSIVRLQRRIYGANLALHYFITTHWVFKNAKFLALNDIIKPADNDDFRFDRFVTGDIRKYFISSMYGKLTLESTLLFLKYHGIELNWKEREKFEFGYTFFIEF